MKRSMLCPFLLLLLFSCQNNKQEVVSDTCSTVNVTYANTISGIINTGGCLSCHSNTSPIAPFMLETYAQVKVKAAEQRNGTSVLYGALAHQSGFSPMPQGLPKLSDCNLAKVKAWIDAGMPQ